MKSGAYFEKGADASLKFDATARWRGDLRDDLEQSGFAGTIWPKKTDDFTCVHVDGDIAQRQKKLVITIPPSGQLEPPFVGEIRRLITPRL